MAHMVLDGEVFRDIVLDARTHLAAHKKEVDSLNVFPVPDGDTGTNMYLTLSSAADAVAGRSGLTLSQASEMVSHGALMGARGNSGVILSQILRGFARYFAGKESVPAPEIAPALDEAVATAYKAVMKPVEGTILTVLRALRDGCAAAAAKESDLASIFECGLREARLILDRTPEMLPVLKQAGVVDAGGKGLVFIVEGFLEALSGTHAEKAGAGEPARGGDAVPGRFPAEELETADIRYPYDTQLLVTGRGMSLSDLREGLAALGDSLLVVGSEDLARVHVHTDRPGDVLNLCLRFGALSDVTIDNMVDQSRAMVERADTFALPPEPVPERVKETGVVSVATGQGLKDIMSSLGCDLVIDGGPTMNPSTAELAAAVKTVPAKKIIFLPNNGNIFLAAKQAKKLTGRNTYIVPSKTIPQGISALLSLNLNEDMEHNLKRASRALKKVKTGEVTFAARTGRFGRHVMNQGDILGLIDGKVEMVGKDPGEMLGAVLKKMLKDGDEIVTVYWGKDVDGDRASLAMEALRADFGDSVEIEFHEGGQPLYYYIVSVE